MPIVRPKRKRGRMVTMSSLTLRVRVRLRILWVTLIGPIIASQLALGSACPVKWLTQRNSASILQR
jgi:hypothetical protein